MLLVQCANGQDWKFVMYAVSRGLQLQSLWGIPTVAVS